MKAKQKLRIFSTSYKVGYESGAVLGTALMLLAALTLIGTAGLMATITDIRIGGDYKTKVQAFYDAEAGVQFALANIRAGIANGTLDLTGLNTTENPNPTISAPTGFSFDPVSTLNKVGTPRDYQFQVTGHVNGASSTIDIVVRRSTFSSSSVGLFGNSLVTLESSSSIYSYDSGSDPIPTPTVSTGAAVIGSNIEVRTDTNYIDGDIELGDDGAGNEGYVTEAPPPSFNDVARVKPDPYGAGGGALAADIAYYSSNNDNGLASPSISGNVINLSSGQSMTLPKGNYYLESITLNDGATLNINSSGSDEVNIYLVGPLDAKAESTITYTSLEPLPTNFTIYSNSTLPITFRNYGNIIGVVYAPFATVEVRNKVSVDTDYLGNPIVPLAPPNLIAQAYGLIFANSMVIEADGRFYYDVALKDKLVSSLISVVSWKEI